jgi:hypothetical protein
MKRILAITFALFALALGHVQAVTFAEWIAGFPGIADATPAGDPDADGMENMLEYAFADLDPTVMDNGSATLPQMVFGLRTGSDIPWRDLTAITYDGSNLPRTGFYYLGLRYKPRADTEGLRWRPQYSWFAGELRYWVDGRATFLPPTAPDGDGYVVRWLQGMFRGASPPPKAFARMQIVL